jgi:hypothetical protein
MSSKAPTLMKRLIVAAGVAAAGAIVAILLGITAAPAAAMPPDPTTCTEAAAGGLLEVPPSDKKVTLCHFTGSDGNPFVINQPSASAAETHAGHHDDCVRYFDGHIQCGL